MSRKRLSALRQRYREQKQELEAKNSAIRKAQDEADAAHLQAWLAMSEQDQARARFLCIIESALWQRPSTLDDLFACFTPWQDAMLHVIPEVGDDYYLEVACRGDYWEVRKSVGNSMSVLAPVTCSTLEDAKVILDRIAPNASQSRKWEMCIWMA